MIPFNRPPVLGTELTYLEQAMLNKKLCGDGEFTKMCTSWFDKRFVSSRTFLVNNCTQALEMAAILIDIQPGDEVIMPSYTFVSTANAFVLRGAKIVFVDIRPDTMNIDESLIEGAITDKTKAIVPVHYAGVACEMDTIMAIAERHNLFVVEDAAQGVMSTYKGKPLGTIGHFGAFSFHETKNYTSGGEGGLLIVNDRNFFERAEIIREKGTNRSLFFKGVVDKYTWVDVGSSFLPSELQAAYLYAQLESAESINSTRLKLWDVYHNSFEHLKDVERPSIPQGAVHNAHMYYLKTQDLQTRDSLIDFLQTHGVQAAFHYIPLHSSPAGKNCGEFQGIDQFTTIESERLLRLPLYFDLSENGQNKVIKLVQEFFAK